MLFPTCVQFGSSVCFFADGVIKVKELDWLKDNLCTGVCFLQRHLGSGSPLWRPEVSALWPKRAMSTATSTVARLLEGSLHRLLTACY